MHLIFCHGFGFTPQFFNDLAKRFNPDCVDYVDLGYFGGNTIYPTPKNRPLILIGHSLGVRKLANFYHDYDLLISLNGFTNFLSQDKTLAKARKLELKALTYEFRKNPTESLKGFYNACQASEFENLVDFSTLQPDKLLNDLEELYLEADFLDDRCLMINYKQDPIVPKQIIDNNLLAHPFANSIMLDYTGHNLGFLHIDIVYDLIIDFVSKNSVVS